MSLSREARVLSVAALVSACSAPAQAPQPSAKLNVHAQLGTGASSGTTDDGRCSDFQLDVERIWSHDVQTSVSAGLVSVSGGFGEKVALQVKTKLDGFARNWVLLKESACRDCLLRETLTEEAYNRISGCLDTVLVRQSTLLELAKSPSRDQVVRLGETLESIADDLKRCRKDALDQEPGPPARHLTKAASKPALAPEIRQLLAEAQTLEEMAAYPAAEAKAAEALGLAHQHGLTDREVDALVREASIKIARGAYVPAAEVALDAEAKAKRSGYRQGRVDALLQAGSAQLRGGRFADAATQAGSARELARAGSGELGAALVLGGEIEFAQGHYESAHALFMQAGTIVRDVFGERHVRTAEVFNNLASVHFNLGRYDEARDLFLVVLEIHKAEFGPDHPTTATTLNNLGMLLQRRGVLGRARQAYERSLAIRLAAFGPVHPDVASAYTNLGSLLQAQGEFERAHAAYQSALDVYKQLDLQESPELASTLSNLGTTQVAEGKLDEARLSFDRALGLREKLLGAEHPDTAISLSLVAGLNLQTRDLPVAQKQAERALAIRQKAYGTSHSATRLSYLQLAAILEERGQLAGAVGYLEKNLAALDGAPAAPGASAEAVGAALARATALEALSHMEERLNYVHFTYVKEQFYTEVENGLGGVTQYFGDSFGRVVKKVMPDGGAAERVFDPDSGDIVDSRGPEGLASLPIIDDDGNPRGFIAADGHSSIVNGSEPFLREVQYLPEGDKFIVRYDELGDPVFYKHPDETFEVIEYDARGRRVSYVDRSGGTTRYTYDAMSNPVRVDLPSGEYHELAYDYLGRHIHYRHPTGRETEYGWDGRSELIFRRMSGGPDEHFQYEANRKRVRLQVGSRVWTRGYGGLGWVIQKTDFDGSVTEYRYDVEGNVIWVRNARGQEYCAERNVLGAIVRVEDFEGVAEERRLDATGQVISLKNPGGASSREYDIDGRLTVVETPDDTFTLTYSRHGVEDVASSAVLVRSKYDAVGQIISEEQGRHETQISWNGGKLERIMSDVGVPLDHTFRHGFLRKLRAGTNEVHVVSPSANSAIYYLSPTLLRKEERDAGGVVQKVVYGTYAGHLGIRDGDLAQLGGSNDFLSVTYAYNEFLEVTGERWSNGRSVIYDLDVGGRIRNKTVSLAGRVIVDETIRYDAVSTPVLPGASYDHHVRPTSYLGESLEYDARGNLIRRIADAGTWSYEWDFVGNLRRVEALKHSVEMDYDGRGRRMAKRVFDDEGNLQKEVTFVWANQTLLREVNHTTGWCRTYLRDPAAWAPFGHVDSKGDEQKNYFYVSDASGLPDLVLDEQGRTVWSAERTTYGDVHVSPASEIDVDVRFAGQLYDSDVQLTYNRNRWYDARVGLYVSPDPISLDGGVALRNYVSNPTLYIDPLGHAAHGNYKKPASLKNDVTDEQFDRSVPGQFANLDPSAATPGFVPCSKDELNAGGDGFSSDTRKKIDAAGAATGCHTCGSTHPMGKEEEDALKEKCKKNGKDYDEELKKAPGAAHFVPDHVPPAGMHTQRGKRGITLDPDDIPAGGVLLLPHCRKCSNKQGGTQSGLLGSLTADQTETLGASIMKTNIEQTQPKPKKPKK